MTNLAFARALQGGVTPTILTAGTPRARAALTAFLGAARPLAARWAGCQTKDASEITAGLATLQTLIGDPTDTAAAMIRIGLECIVNDWDREASCDQDIGDALTLLVARAETAL